MPHKTAARDGNAEDRAWLDSAAACLGDRLAALEADVPPERLDGWLRSMDEGATSVMWDEAAGAFVEVGATSA